MNEAVTEWQKAWFFKDEAGDVSGSESLIKQAQAIRCLTRTQSYAKQVYETLVPPAVRPEDLKLKPWFGDWGEWATRESGKVIKEY